jgi:pimeloyl-ACP methyl ester carboxylesterase
LEYEAPVDVTTLSVGTPDGWQLELTHLSPATRRHPRPLLLLHGFGANRFVMWHRPGPTLAEHLCHQGFDAYCLDHRGTRHSRHPDGARAHGRVTVDDKIALDLPAAIDAVLADAGAEELDVVGHSLGGTSLVAYLSHRGDARVRRAVTIASPLRFRLPLAAHAALLAAARPGARRALPERIPMRGFAELGLATNLVFPARPHFNMANVERSMILHMMRHGVDDASLRELEQLAAWSRGAFRSLDGSIDYGRGLAAITASILVLGAAVDSHVAPRELHAAAARIGPEGARVHVVGEASGAERDYGHTDLLLGRHAAREVFPIVARWLADVDG